MKQCNLRIFLTIYGYTCRSKFRLSKYHYFEHLKPLLVYYNTFLVIQKLHSIIFTRCVIAPDAEVASEGENSRPKQADKIKRRACKLLKC
jgi:hypothetical protein